MKNSAALPRRDFEGAVDQIVSKDRLSYLDVLQLSQVAGTPLDGLTVTVIGAGPTGLVFAKTATALGAKVTILEKAGDPRGPDPGYTNRSFNITLDEVGRYVLADERIWKNDGIWLVGRAAHNRTELGSVDYFEYPETAKIVSIPRHILRKNMVAAVLEQGATILFHSHVTHTDPDTGVTKYLMNDGNEGVITSDLVVIADGLHSIGDKFRSELYGEDWGISVEPRSYVSAQLKPEEHDNLSLHHIHFWQETVSDSFTLGLPVRDGGVVLLIDSPFADLGRKDAHPFPTLALAKQRMEHDFPQLHAAAPMLYKQLPERVRSHFSTKLVSSYRIGERAVLVGDAACVFPPWAGIGANSAMYAAGSLAYQLVHAKDMAEALSAYEAQQRFLSPHMIKLAKDVGDIFNKAIIEKPSISGDMGLALLIQDARRQAGQLPD